MALRMFPKPSYYTLILRNYLIFFSVLNVSLIQTGSQKLCISPKTEIPSKNIIFMENFSARKCMQMEGLGILPDSKVILGECLHRTKLGKDQQFQIIFNSQNKITFQQDAGRGENYCLTTSGSTNDLKSTLCNTKNLDQSWTLKPLQGQPGSFTVEQFSSKKCLKPKTRATRSPIQLASCNAHETEQIWKVLYSNPATNSSAVVIPC